MRLSEFRSEEWKTAGFSVPEYDREKVRAKTEKAPAWLHFGYGNIFRAFPAAAMEKLLAEGKADVGIVAVEGYDEEIVEGVMRPLNDLTVNITLKADGTLDKAVIGSIVQSLTFKDADALEAHFANESLQMVSFTVTEKGYNPQSAYMKEITRLLWHRYTNGGAPIAMVSMDNCSQNGDRLKNAVLYNAEEYGEGFVEYINSKVSFPWTMIDKITPRPDERIGAMTMAEHMDISITKKGTYIAPFTNAEETQYLIVEDSFPSGRPPLEEAGIIFTDRATVKAAEKMKVCTCLNPLHTALAVFGCLLGYELISEEMKDPDLYRLVDILGRTEGLPASAEPGVIEPKKFLDEVIHKRLCNPFLPDTPQRIATDTSQKIAIRFGETVKSYMEREELDVESLRALPLVLAGWLRYLDATDDELNKMELSPDPWLDELRAADRKELLRDSRIFGTDMYGAGLGERIMEAYNAMKGTRGGVRNALKNLK